MKCRGIYRSSPRPSLHVTSTRYSDSAVSWRRAPEFGGCFCSLIDQCHRRCLHYLGNFCVASFVSSGNVFYLVAATSSFFFVHTLVSCIFCSCCCYSFFVVCCSQPQEIFCGNLQFSRRYFDSFTSATSSTTFG